MKVICKRATTKLVKGAVYDVIRLSNVPNGTTYWRAYVTIKVSDTINDTYSVKNFTTVDGKELPAINWESPTLKVVSWEERTIDETIKKGDFVTYASNKSSTFHKGSIYTVTDVNIEKKSWTTAWSGVTQNHTSTSIWIKVEGSTRWMKSYSFQKVPSEVARNIALQKLLDEKVDIETAGAVRKIDKFSETEKDKVLFRIIAESMLDNSRNNMSIIDWAIHKSGKVYGVTKEDLEPILKKSINKIISEWNN